MIAVAALSGCGHHTASDAGDATRAPDSIAPVTSDTTRSDSVLVALGNEPFWNVRVTAREIVYADPENQEGCRFPLARAEEEGSDRVYRTRRDLSPGETGPRVLELRIRQGACSDGMSDRQYAMAAALQRDGEWLRGCAMVEPDRPTTPRTRPSPGPR